MRAFTDLLNKMASAVDVSVHIGNTDPVLGTTISLDNVEYDLVSKHLRHGSQLATGWVITAFDYPPGWKSGRAVDIKIAESTDKADLVLPLIRYHLDWKLKKLDPENNNRKTDLDWLPYPLRSRFCYCKPHETHCGVCACGQPGHRRTLEATTGCWCDKCYFEAISKLKS